jgi:hypothetical protein
MRHFFPKQKLSTNLLLLIPEAFLQLTIARIKVSFFHSSYYLPVFSVVNKELKTKVKISKAQIIATTINGLSTRTPFKSTCLVKVLAAHKMLIKRSIPHCLHLGILVKPNHTLNAHAWLSVSASVIIGAQNLPAFKEIYQMEI